MRICSISRLAVPQTRGLKTILMFYRVSSKIRNETYFSTCKELKRATRATRAILSIYNSKSEVSSERNSNLVSGLVSSTFTNTTALVLSRRLVSDSSYQQIPEHLKLHMFVPELKIIREDELKAPYKDFSSTFLLGLLEFRANEVRLEKGDNSNPGSRLSSENVVRFMKLLSRLKQLFDLNGGNTEILDTVLRSQETLDAFEAKLAAKKEARSQSKTEIPHSKAKELGLFTPGPYLQIPDSLELHEFAAELQDFMKLELQKPYKDISAEELVNMIGIKLNLVQAGEYRDDKCQVINSKNLPRFYDLHSKLKKVLAWNGGHTGILDTLIESQEVFKQTDALIQSKKVENGKLSGNASIYLDCSQQRSSPYKEISSDMFFEEYSEELEEIKHELGSKFAAASALQVLKIAEELSEKYASSEKGLIFSKLYRNLSVLFKHNDNQTFVLDNILISNVAFDKLDSRLLAEQSSPNGSENSELKINYRGSDHVINLLNKASAGEHQPSALGREEQSIKDALSHAMSKEEKSLHASDPSEYQELVELTPDKIRSSYRPVPVKGDLGHIDKRDFEKYLKHIKHKKKVSDENVWREKTAFEWSTTLRNNHRSFKTRNFFNGKSAPKKTDFPMFPGVGEDKEYLILTSNGDKYRTQKNPLGLNHVPEDMFAILQTLSEEELAKFSRNVEKLRKRGWRLIGSGRTKGTLVLSKNTRGNRLRIGKFVKLVFISSASSLIILLFVNWLVEDTAVYESLEESGNSVEQLGNRSTVSDEVNKIEGESAGNTEKSGWQKLLWR